MTVAIHDSHGAWIVADLHGDVASIHNHELDHRRPGVYRCAVEERAYVLGSTTDAGLLDERVASAQNAVVARRRSGGGVVALDPATAVWVDVFVPNTHADATADVVAAFRWMGGEWRSALQRSGWNDVVVHHGGPVRTELGRIACFAGIGHGEVLLDGRKVLGLSQRRTRQGARFQCVLYREWDPGPLIAVLDGRVPSGLDAVLRDGVGDVPDADVVVRHLVEQLTSG